MNIIGLYGESVYTRLGDFYRTGNYKAVPLVLLSVNGERPEPFFPKTPFRFFRKDMELRQLDYISQSKGVSADFLRRPDEAYRRMRKLVENNMDRVIADMMSTIIIERMEALYGEDPEADNLFFIGNPNSDKIIGRLGYLCPDQTHTTICFVSYRIVSLMTNVISQGENRLSLDINYFLEYRDRPQSDIYPNDYRESMLQTLFYRMEAPDKAMLPPLRIDIFSQGISNREINEKAALIREVLKNKENLSLPFPDDNSATHFLRIPKALHDCLEAAKISYRPELEQMLRED